MVKVKKSKELCSGCRENFYNGNNQYGIKECWYYKSAEVVKKGVYFSLNDIKPTMTTTLNCFTPQR